MDEREILTAWTEGLKTPEGQSACLYTLGMTMGTYLQDLKLGELEPELARDMASLLRRLRDMLIASGANTEALDELWLVFLEETKFEGPTVWDFIADEA